MKNQNLKEKIDEIFKKDERFWDKEKKVILRNTISDYAENFDEKFLEMLLSDKTAKEHFFKKIGKMMVFDKEKFLAYINNKDFLENSYTKFTQNIGLTDEGQFLKSAGKVILHWPYKDCILEGGQTKETVKRNEIFFNEVLEKDEIDVLLKPKVFSKFEKFSKKNGKAKGAKLEKFTRDANGTIKDNLIVKGNNLIVLHSLKEEFAGKVKLIYIDPPYNTGNDGFKYNDNFNHSSWLTFMKNRLEVARELLADDGVIFVQCDYNEAHYLRILLDEIFGRDNFINEIIWKRKFGTANETKRFATAFDNIYLYGKSDNFKINLIRDKETRHAQEYIKNRFTRKDEKGIHKGKLWMPYPLANPGKPTKNLLYEYKGYKSPIKGWRMIKQSLKKLDTEERLYFPDDKTQRIQEKKFLDEYNGQPIDTLWSDIFVINSQSKEAFDFTGQKPEDLLKRILLIGTNENDIVLDFFAGSGTSGAVAHKMGRQYILVEQMDYIKDLPEARIKKVIEGEQGGISKAVNWKGGGEFVYMEMKEFNQEFLTAIKKAKSKEDLKEIYEDIQEKAFLSYRFTDERFQAKISEFNELDLNEQKQVLAEILDKNLLYLSYSEMEDATYKISKKDIKINDNFYNEG